MIYVKNPENFRIFMKKVLQKFGGSLESSYLCIRFRTKRGAPPVGSGKERVL